MCIEGVDGTVKWSPIKISRSSVRLSSSSEGEDINTDQCLSLDFQVKDGVILQHHKIIVFEISVQKLRT